MSIATEQQPWEVAVALLDQRRFKVADDEPWFAWAKALVKEACMRYAAAIQDRLALYDSAEEIITTPSGRVWVAAEKHEVTVDRLQDAILPLLTEVKEMRDGLPQDCAADLQVIAGWDAVIGPVEQALRT